MATVSSLLVLAAALFAADAAADVTLVTFDASTPTGRYKWRELNDPVMGGKSAGTFSVDTSGKVPFGVFDGVVRVVPSLHAPGFTTAATDPAFERFASAESFTHLSMKLRSTKPYYGFKIAFAADTLNPQFRSFKADFNISVSPSGDWQEVLVPFTDFSNRWSQYTGEPVVRCSDDKSVCPTERNKAQIEQFQIWAEGHAGEYHLEIASIGATNSTCSSSQYCCPDAKHCLTPTNVSCASGGDGACAAGQACCPITKLCVDVGAPCKSPCADQASYCCPDALHCLTPTNPGHLCRSASDCSGQGEVCCPVTHECVSVGAKCTPP